jgi:hypothetical protein
MALLKKEKICSVEVVDKTPGQPPRRVYYRIGEILTFRDDANGDVYQRIKLSLLPGQTFHVFADNGNGQERADNGR